MSQQNEKKERKQFEEKFYPLHNFIMAKEQKFRTKQAIFYNENKIQIFRAQDLIKLFVKNKEKVNKILPQINQKNISFEDDKDAILIVKLMLENKIITRLERHPDDPQKKWPKRLQLLKNKQDQSYNEEAFYTWNISVRGKLTNFWMFMILFTLFMAFLYPIWPFSVKYAVFKVSLYFCIFLLGFILSRYVVFVIVRLFGWRFWILPNFDEDVSFFDSFKPLYTWDRAQDGKIEIIFRLVGIISLVMLVYAVSQEPQMINDLQEASGQTVDDILDWGKSKLEGKNEPLHKRAIPDLSDILKEEDESLKMANNQTETKQQDVTHKENSLLSEDINQDQIINQEDKIKIKQVEDEDLDL